MIMTIFCIPYLCLFISLSLSLPVPTPSVSLSVSSGPLYEGTSQTLTCTVTLPEAVDSDVTVCVVWRFTSTPVVPSAHVQISPVSSTRSPFISTLTLSPLSMSDAGEFSCEATANSTSQYITASSPGVSQHKTVTVEGMLLNVMKDTKCKPSADAQLLAHGAWLVAWARAPGRPWVQLRMRTANRWAGPRNADRIDVLAERAKPGRGKPVLNMHIGFLACFHAISLERSRFSKIATFIFLLL